ncbi:MAG TPA: S41 family peptidase [Pyrinomonadaceae bacterium]|nr:S41 family peptidase [Pyrinomonadaceae bacterium]
MAQQIGGENKPVKTLRRPLAVLCLGLTFLLCKSLYAQQPQTAQGANEYVRKQREEAEKLWRQKDAGGVGVLHRLLDYLYSPAVIELAEGNFYLRKSLSDIHYDLARAYGLKGDAAAALTELGQVVEEGGVGIDPDGVSKEPAFDAIRQEPRYRRVIAQLAAQKRLWGNAAFSTPYKENLSPEDKLAGLSELWAEVKYNFVNFDHVPDLDWDAAYRSYIPKVLQTKSTADYYRALQEMCALLKDAHTDVDPPEQLLDEFYSRPPIITGMVEGKVLVLKVGQAAESLGLRSGQEILAVDDTPVQEYAAARVMPFQSSSTPQDMLMRAYTYALLAGPKSRPVSLTLRDYQGRVFKRRLLRTGWREPGVRAYERRMEFKVLADNIGYIAINDFDGKEINQAFEAKFDAIAQTSALIIDLRNNGGGSGSVAYRILATLADRPFAIFQIRSKDYIGYFRSSGGYAPSWYVQNTVPAGEWPPDGKRLYNRPVVVLTSAATGSSAEDFVVAFDFMKRGEIIGEPTGGSSGQPFYFTLPGGGSARVCTIRDRYPDGREFIGLGVQPHVTVHPTLVGVRAGRDEVLEAALGRLKEETR